jgi:flagellar assembly protein FliH
MTPPDLPSPPFPRRRGPHLLFEEDFDGPVQPPAPEPPPEPEVIEPVFTAAELKAAREEAWREADELARAELASARAAAVQLSLATIAEQLGQAAQDAHTMAEDSAEAIAQLLLAGFAAAFPVLSRRHGKAEVQAVLQRILPALDCEPKVSIRVSPELAVAVAGELEQLDPDIAALMQIVPVETMSPGDVRINWRAGQAVRDTARLWQEIEAVLAPNGLLPPPSTILQQTQREDADVE